MCLILNICFVLFQCSFFESNNLKIIFRRYATLYFIVGVDDEEVKLVTIEMIVLEFSLVKIHMYPCHPAMYLTKFSYMNNDNLKYNSNKSPNEPQSYASSSPIYILRRF